MVALLGIQQSLYLYLISTVLEKATYYLWNSRFFKPPMLLIGHKSSEKESRSWNALSIFRDDYLEITSWCLCRKFSIDRNCRMPRLNHKITKILEPVKVLLVALEKNCAMLLEISARHRCTRANWLSDISLTASGVGERHRSYGSLTFDISLDISLESTNSFKIWRWVTDLALFVLAEGYSRWYSTLKNFTGQWKV